MPSVRCRATDLQAFLALVVPQVRHFYCLSIGFRSHFAASHQVSPRGLFVAKHALKYIHFIQTCLLVCIAWVDDFVWNLKFLSQTVCVVSHLAISDNACIVTYDTLTCNFCLFSRVETLAQTCNSCHANSCLSGICTCLHIFVFFSIVHCLKYACFVSARKHTQ